MLGLAIHTSSPALGLALSNFETETRHQTWAFGRDLSAHLHQTLMEFVQPYPWPDLSFLAVARGPGGFTGTRIGVVVARTLAQQLEIPLFGVSSLAALAQWQVEQTPDLSPEAYPVLAVAMRAQRDQCFTALYQPTSTGLQILQPEAVVTPAEWEATLAHWPRATLTITAEDDGAKTVPQVLSLAYQAWQQGKRPHWSEVLPYYGQHPVET
jgi:tRNA threonylcarbamoyl adenosine modification protein YeaZ